MGVLPEYKLKLRKSYYENGFFNIAVAVDRFVRPDSGSIAIELGSARARINGTVNREANPNGTARIHGGPQLRNWLQRSFKEGAVVDVVILAPGKLWIRAPMPPQSER